MKWSLEFVEKRDYLRVTIEGEFNPSDHLLMIEDILSQKYWKSDTNVFLDSRKVDYSKSNFDMMRLAGINMSRFKSQIGKGRAAILMGTVTTFGKGRQFEIISEEKVSANIKTFLDESAALSWLTDDGFII